MGYCLVNGKRCYRDEATGIITEDNVSQEMADRRKASVMIQRDPISELLEHTPAVNRATAYTPRTVSGTTRAAANTARTTFVPRAASAPRASSGTMRATSGTARAASKTARTTSDRARVSSGTRGTWILVLLLIGAVTGAVVYNHTHTSYEEQAIEAYMEQEGGEADSVEEEIGAE